MSLSNSICISFRWPNVDVFTFGKSSLYGYDPINHCLVVHSPIRLNNPNDISNDRLHLSSSPTWPIRRLILNEDETILALLADKIVYLVYLPQSNTGVHHHSPSKGSRLCPIIRVPPSSPTINCSLIDFVWLTSNHFIIVYSIPSSSDCHLYSIRPSKQDGLEHLQTFSVGLPSKNKFETPNKKISLHQPSDIIKLDVTKRQEKDFLLILLFAMKTDGDIFLLEIEENQLLHENKNFGEFQGPIRILPSTFDNYGADHGQSTFICLSNSIYPLVVFTRDNYQLNQCIILSPTINQYYLFTIDLISLPTNQNGQILTSIIPDRFSSNKYYIADSSNNIYLIEILWIDQIQQGLKQLQSTHIQHLISAGHSNNKMINKIEQMGLIQIDNNEEYLAVIVKSQINQQKELILVRSQPSKSVDSSLTLSESTTSGFLDRIRSILYRDQSIPYVTLSSSSSSTNISDSDLEKNLYQFIKLLTEQYIAKQEQVRKELENKRSYLLDFQKTQSNENEQLNQKFQQIQNQLQILTEQYRQECSRRKRLSLHVNDLLSVIDQNTPILSDEEIRMQQQLETYQIQIECLKEKIQLIQQFVSLNQNQQHSENLSMENMQNFVRNHRNQIDQMKKQLETIQINK